MLGGYAILKEYLANCLSVLMGKQTGAKATTGFTDYLAKHNDKIYGWSFDLFDNWLGRGKLPDGQATALRQLTSATKERLIRPE